MKNVKFRIFAIIFPLLVSCGKTATTVNSDKEITGNWLLESVVQQNDTIHRPSKKNGIYDISITFKEKGELEATSSTNYLTGFYETAQLNSIQLDGDGTERKETPWGNLFINALPHVNIYDLKSNKLILSCDNDSQLIFDRVQK
ncbi:hypothetical protein [Dyadobacter sp. NIV53]|uniref:hypothetical protein n=1 Tax=Dyadobacter sp. NIV53 TaxID=2861765 RepID=UPI001C88910C|nr:hypothetical protein [Dyadobacter sp. NIV53]